MGGIFRSILIQGIVGVAMIGNNQDVISSLKGSLHNFMRARSTACIAL
jgi:hypothetical protein